ncbi:MAG: hypothetical protein LQ338_006863, partial [Usnochroma carphineum]
MAKDEWTPANTIALAAVLASSTLATATSIVGIVNAIIAMKERRAKAKEKEEDEEKGTAGGWELAEVKGELAEAKKRIETL